MCIKKINHGYQSERSGNRANLAGIAAHLPGRVDKKIRMKKNDKENKNGNECKVRQVKSFAAGKLENVLIPILISAGMITKVNQNKDKKVEQDRPEMTKAELGFIHTLVHALNCKSCDLSCCRKMRLVIGHFLSCPKMSNSLSCTVCNQMLTVMHKHANNCNNQASCPVPVCDSIRAEKLALINTSII